ncbi:MAG: queuosine salvage family protein, partial [Chloroflexota bacterium]
MNAPEQIKDPLNVLASTRAVIDRAEHVWINTDSVAGTAQHLASGRTEAPQWDSDLHPTGRNDAETATLILILDALNFCFWPAPGDDRPRWRVTYRGVTYDGYAALAVALRRAVEDGVPLTDPNFLAGIDDVTTADLLDGDPGTQKIP